MQRHELLRKWGIVLLLPVIAIAMVTATATLTQSADELPTLSVQDLPLPNQDPGNQQPPAQDPIPNPFPNLPIDPRIEPTPEPFPGLTAEDLERQLNSELQGQPGLEPTPELGPAFRTTVNAALQLDPDRTSWEEAGPGFDGGRVGRNLRASWVMLDPSGTLFGSVWTLGPGGLQPAMEMKVFVLRRGFVVTETTTDPDGRFRAEGLTEGVYSLVGYSPTDIFAFGFNAIGYRAVSANLPTEINTMAVPKQSRLISDLIAQYVPRVRFRAYADYQFDETDTDPAGYYGLKGIGEFQPPAEPALTIQRHRVPILSDGRVVGRLRLINPGNGRPVQVVNTDVMLLQNEQIIASARVDTFGVFQFQDLPPGFYGLVAAGEDSIGIVGLEIVDPRDAPFSQRQGHSEYQLVSTSAAVADPPAIDLSLMDPESVGWLNYYVNKEALAEALRQPLNLPPKGNYAIGLDGFGSGIGGGPGAPFAPGRWLLPLGLAALIVAAIDDGSPFPPIPPPPISPIHP